MSFLGDIFGGLFGGDGGSSSQVTSTVNVDIQGLDKIGVTETIELKPVEIKPLKLTLDENIDLSKFLSDLAHRGTNVGDLGHIQLIASGGQAFLLQFAG